MAGKFLPRLAYNWISGLGAAVAAVSFLTAASFLALSIFAGMGGPYLGVVIYILLPVVIFFSLLLIPLGMWRQSRRLRKEEAGTLPRWPCIDFNDRRVRNGTLLFSAGMVLYVLASTVGSYQAYHYTESVGFCGRLCHTVMKPQYVAHKISPHAVIACTSCHVGPGADWYTKSKIRGISRVYEVAFENYPRPIPSPISDLRPEELECHGCHWPPNFFGGQRRIYHNYMYDEKNTYWPVDMTVHIGGGNPEVDQTGGIHWYMNIGYQIEYIARDPQRQDIPWVRATNKQTGEVTVYQSRIRPLAPDEIAGQTPRRMDCIDCHNCPAHIFRAPDYAVNTALFIEEINPRLPGIKKTAVAAMAASYTSEEEALSGIADAIRRKYESGHPPPDEKKKAEIDRAVQAVQKRFAVNIFPSMKADWKTYPDHVGHYYSKGCFRCHLGEHRSNDGKTIPHECNTCHTIRAQGSGPQAQTATTTAGLDFRHPVDVAGVWRKLPCSDCHTGAGR